MCFITRYVIIQLVYNHVAIPYQGSKNCKFSQNYLTAILYNSLDKGPKLFITFIQIHTLKHLTPFNLS